MTLPQYEHVLFRGQHSTARQKQAINAVEEIIGMEFSCPQGSWEAPSDWSGTTHTAAGVVDLWLPRMDDPDWVAHVTRALRRVGMQAAFPRGPWTKMPYHWHTCDLDTHGMDTNAVWQVGQFRATGGPFNGLNAGVRDLIPYRPSPLRKWDYKA